MVGNMKLQYTWGRHCRKLNTWLWIQALFCHGSKLQGMIGALIVKETLLHSMHPAVKLSHSIRMNLANWITDPALFKDTWLMICSASIIVIIVAFHNLLLLAQPTPLLEWLLSKALSDCRQLRSIPQRAQIIRIFLFSYFNQMLAFNLAFSVSSTV